jgi:phage baseplate assembly protein W
MTLPVPNILSWPLGSVDDDGHMDWSRDDKSIRDVMLNILLTRPGERLMRPDFGAGLLNFVHQPNNETTRNLIAGVVRKSLAQWEPRVVVDRVDVEPSSDRLAQVHIVIGYHLRHHRAAKELSFALDLGQV